MPGSMVWRKPLSGHNKGKMMFSFLPLIIPVVGLFLVYLFNSEP